MKSQATVYSKLNLGAQWKQEEIDIFFEEYKANPENIDKIREELSKKGFQRTNENIVSLITKNKTYLSLSSASSRDLGAILSDYYASENNLPSNESCEDIVCRENLQIRQPTAITKSFKRTHYLLQGHSINNEFLPFPREILVKDEFPYEKKSLFPSFSQINHQLSLKKNSDSDLLKKSNNPKFGKYIPGGRPFRKMTKGPKRGLLNANPFIYIYDDFELQRDPKLAQIVKERHQMLNPFVKRWIRFEFFYSYVDRAYFSQNELIQCLHSIQINTDLLKLLEWAVVRKSLGKQRRFSKAFIFQERAKLSQFREYSQQLLYSNKSKIEKTFIPSFEKEYISQILSQNKITQLIVGQRVLALHPLRHELKTGSILTIDMNSFFIQFDNLELGVHNTKSSDIFPIQESKNVLNKFTNKSTSDILWPFSNNPEMQDNENELKNEDELLKQVNIDKVHQVSLEQTKFNDSCLYSMSSLINLLEIKNLITKQMSRINDEIEINKEQGDNENQIFGWLGIIIRGIDRLIKMAERDFRIRIVNQTEEENKEMQNKNLLPELFIEEEYPELTKEIDKIKSNPNYPFFLNLTRLLKQALEGGIDSLNCNMLLEVKNGLSSSNIDAWKEIESLIP